MFDDLEVTNTITHSYGDSVYNFHVQVMEQDKSQRSDRRYYWFYQGKVNSTVGNHAGKVLHGAFEKYDRQGNLIEKGNYSHGLKDGAWVSWHVNGNIAKKYTWSNGWRANKFQEYYPTGSLSKTGVYKNDKLTGKVSYYTPAGEISKEERYRNGVLTKSKDKRVKEKKVKEKKLKTDVPDSKSGKKKKAAQEGTEIQTLPSQQPSERVEEKNKRSIFKKRSSGEEVDSVTPSGEKPAKERKTKRQPSSPPSQ